jgi:hypothetical protein
MVHGFTLNFGVNRCDVYLNEHSFNNPKFTCFIAKYTTAYIHTFFEIAAGQELQAL